MHFTAKPFLTVRWMILFLFAAALWCTTATAQASSPKKPPMLTPAERQTLSTIQSQVFNDLKADVLPFWTRDTVDPSGGFNTDVDRYGKPLSKNKYLVMQARMVWTLSAAQRYGIKDKRYLDLATQGVHFLTEKMWDPEFGGFYMSVDGDGKPTNTNKYLYSQEFVLYALAEYARNAPGEAQKRYALDWAGKLFDLIQEKCRDHQYPGYQEDFDQQWKLLPESIGVGGIPSGKTFNTHMHLMEAFTALVDVDPQPRYKKALAEVTDLLLAKVVTPQGNALEPFDRQWRPVPEGQGRLSTYYGHDVEFAWLLLDALHTLGRSPETQRKTFFGLIDNALAKGFDNERGGIAGIGPRVGAVVGDPAYKNDLSKEWWEQAEALTALITAFGWSGDRKYLTAFEKEWRWVWTYQIDHEAGDWYSSVDWDTGKPSSLDKGDRGWKASYHNGRALMRVNDQLEALLAQK